jgi:hypothetical protein
VELDFMARPIRVRLGMLADEAGVRSRLRS